MIPDPDAGQPVGARSGEVPGAPDDPDWVVRSEERARVAFPTRVRARVRLVKQVVTEEVTQTFTVRREVLHVVEEPGDGDDASPSWERPLPDDVSGRDFEIVLHAEQVVASTVVVPVERIRVSHRLVATDVEVSADLRREQITVETRPGAPTAGPSPAGTDPYDDQAGDARTTEEELP